MSDRRY